MAHQRPKLSQATVDRAKRRIERGLYDDPDTLDAVLDIITKDDTPKSLLRAIDACAVGDGNKYRDLTARVLLRAWKGKVDRAQVRRELPIAGGRSDIELPFTIDALRHDPKLSDWRERFDLTSL